MKKRIGILTFHRAVNYGAVLQTYALVQTLKEMRHDVAVIDYRCPEIENVYRPFYVGECKSSGEKIKKLLKSLQLFKKRKRFEAFLRAHLPLTSPCRSEEALAKAASEFDIVITGSDQVFNTDLAGGKMTYLLDFVPDHVKKLSYAASFGFAQFDSQDTSKIKALLERFDGISLRESSGVALVQAISDKDALCVADPTLLISKSQWEQLAKKPKKAPEKIILVNIMGNCDYAVTKARELAKQGNARVAIINPTLSQQLHCRDCLLYPTASPEEYLWLLSHAETVVTTSFHGLALSLGMGKDVYAEAFTKKLSSRITDLLDSVGLSHRLLPQESEEPIAWDQVEAALHENATKSKNWLRKQCEADTILR